MIKESKFCSKVIEEKFSKSLVMTKKDHKDFNNSTKYWVCKKANEEGLVKVKDHNHISEKRWGYVHHECNINLSLSLRIPVVFYNFQIYDSDLIFQKIGKHNFKIDAIPESI